MFSSLIQYTRKYTETTRTFTDIADSLITHYYVMGLVKIPFAPLAFVHQRLECPSYLPSLLVFFLISTDFTLPPRILVTPNIHKSTSLTDISGVEPRALTRYLIDRLRYSLRPINPDNACTLRITEASGT